VTDGDGLIYVELEAPNNEALEGVDGVRGLLIALCEW
jgi:hypothetical protein